MWIKRIILENFACVKVGMKTNRIEIDFSNRKNKICLLVGPNGIGKTSLISTFTPFATLGNLDVRDSGNLIIEGKNGYKEIIIIDRGNEYVIKHFYMPKESGHSVKSYISKNEIELNENGNVRSFLSVVEAELGLEINFLKLIRLGNNVTNLLQLSATDRKKFLSNLLQDLDVYLNYFKKLTEDARILKNQISHVSDKIGKTGIDDLDKTKELLEFTRKELSELSVKKDTLSKEIGVIEHALDEIRIYDIQEEKDSLSKKIKKAEKAQEKTSNVYTLSEYQELLSKSEQELSEIKTILAGKEAKIGMLRASIDELLSESNSLQIQIEKEANNEALLSAKNIFYKLRVQVNDDASTYEKYHPSYTKDELNDFLSTMMEIDQILSTAYEFGKEPIRKVVSLVKESRSVSNFINNGLLEYDSSKQNRSSLLYKLMDEVDSMELSCDHKECGMYKLWFDIKALMTKEENMKASNDTEEFYKYMDIVNQRISRVLELLKEKKDFIQKLPIERQQDFLANRIFSAMESLSPIYNRETYNVLLTEITEYENYLSIVDQYKEAEKNYELLKSNSSEKYLTKRREDVISSIDEKTIEMKKLQSEIRDNDIRQSEIQDIIEYNNDMIVALSELQGMKERHQELSDTELKFKELSSKASSLMIELSEVDKQISKRANERYGIMMAIDSYKSLMKELNKYQTLYSENSLIKRAMSSKEGIPLEFINIYMRDIQTTINDLLDIVYDGSLTIDEFKISADEFRIPYVKEGYLIPDIISASQGETAFLSIALSFALIAKNILNYNIVLLDEIDGNLDKKKRKKFIAILEKLIDMIDAEQIFLISHNDLFSMYPVDVLELDEENHELQLGNYIKVLKE